jgi:hypothetical protein
MEMAWQWWALILSWPLTGFIALAMDIRDHPAMQLNIGLAEVWPVIFGPFWLMIKLWDWWWGGARQS